ncbi:MAG: UPF0236 family transposase-like protein [Syntrophomonadaceae bacterium]|jgi:hypothetical protein
MAPIIQDIAATISGKFTDEVQLEADEDHVALQDGRHAEPKLVYLHEGKKSGFR